MKEWEKQEGFRQGEAVTGSHKKKREMIGGSLLILVIVLISVVMVVTFYDRGKKALAIFPDIHSVSVLYRDKTAVGYSTRSGKSQFGKARKSMDIVVTDKELWLTSFVLLAGITQQHDLIHKVPLSRITKIKEGEREVTLDFKNEKGQTKQVVINTRDQMEFLKHIRQR